jgi:hypothetical protein
MLKLPRQRGIPWPTLINPKGLLQLSCFAATYFGCSARKELVLRNTFAPSLTSAPSSLFRDPYSQTLNFPFLTSLPDSWDTFISGINTSSLAVSTKLVAQILEQDRRRKAKPSSDEVALPAYSNKHKHKQAKFNPDVTCYGCSRIGHMVGDCRDVKSGKSFTKAEKEKNTYTSKERYNSK